MSLFFMRKKVALGLCALLLVQLVGCGTLIYPERRGQTSGEIDPTVAILDGIGLLFFVVPGLVAFAIDFTTGAIYLPGGQKAKEKLNKMKKSLGGRLEERNDLLVWHVDPQALTPHLVEEIGRELAGAKAFPLIQVAHGAEGLATQWSLWQQPLMAKACY
jgi:hypothetical protein